MLKGAVLLGRFEIEVPMGGGAMGAVYRALDRATGARVALKVLRVGVMDGDVRFEREVRVLRGFDHPNIVKYVAHGQLEDGTPVLAMEWVDGEELSRRLARARLTVDETIVVARQVLDALAYVHRGGVVHRDIKPSNVLLAGGDLTQAKLMDFGLARIDDIEESISRSGFLVGTPPYMAPEQVRGDRSLDGRADLFSLGCLLYKCLTGRGPFHGPDAMGVLTRVLFDEPPPLLDLRPDVPEEVDDLIARLLEKQPERRPRTAADARRALDGLAASASSTIPPAPEHLTDAEQRLVSFVIATEGATVAQEAEVTLRQARGIGDDDEARRLAAKFGARLEVLGDGTLAAAITSDIDRGANATDQVARAARLALALAKAVPKMHVVVATGRAELGAHPVGDGIDRSILLLKFAEAAKTKRGVAIMDEVTAGLLGPSFEVTFRNGLLELVSERDMADAVRTLLGKPTPFVGREREVEMALEALSDCITRNEAHALVVTADTGVGKSRLRSEIVRRLREEQKSALSIVLARGDAMTQAAPLGIIVQLVRALVGLSSEPPDVVRARLRARIARNVPAQDVDRVFDFMAELLGAGESDDSSVPLRAARVDPRIMNDQLERAWEDLVRAECRAGPLVIVLEDLHWCDAASVQFLTSTVRTLLDAPLFILALARPAVHQAFPSLRDAFHHEITLQPLTARAARRLATAVLPDRSESELERIVEHAGGNAFFLEELLRALAENRSDSLPETVVAVLLSRFERLSTDARRVLRAASVIGSVFWRGAVDVLLGGGASTSSSVVYANSNLWDALEELQNAELIFRRRDSRIDGEEEWSFRHANVREAAYGMLTDRDRRVGHALIGAWLEARGERDCAMVAEHLELGAEPERAVAYWKRAAVQAMEGGDLAMAIRQVQRGVGCGAEGPALGALRLIEAGAEVWIGRYAEAEIAALEAFDLLPEGSDAWFDAIGEVAQSAGTLGHIETLVQVRDAALANQGAIAPRTVAIARLGAMLLLVARAELAEPLIAETKRVDRSALEAHPLAMAYLARLDGFCALREGKNVAYFRAMERATEAFQRAGDRRNECAHAANAGFGATQVGAHGDAARLLARANEWAKDLGILSIARKNVARLEYVLGDYEAAERHAREAADKMGSYGHARLECYAYAYRGGVLLAMDRKDEALEAARRAVLCGKKFRGAYANALATLSRIQLARGEQGEALSAATEAKEIFDDLGNIEDGEMLVRLAHAEALASADRNDEARAATRAAVERLDAMAAEIEIPEWRVGFEKTPEVAATYALAQRLGIVSSAA